MEQLDNSQIKQANITTIEYEIMKLVLVVVSKPILVQCHISIPPENV